MYFAVVFAAGFVLGVVRVLLLVPRLGELPATMLELPAMLGISWVVCAKVIARYQVQPRMRPRLTMGVVALSLLIVAELVLSLTLFSRSINDFAHALMTAHGMIGLAGQVLFGLMPVIAART
jgi:hypothetical protein